MNYVIKMCFNINRQLSREELKEMEKRRKAKQKEKERKAMEKDTRKREEQRKEMKRKQDKEKKKSEELKRKEREKKEKQKGRNAQDIKTIYLFHLLVSFFFDTSLYGTRCFTTCKQINLKQAVEIIINSDTRPREFSFQSRIYYFFPRVYYTTTTTTIIKEEDKQPCRKLMEQSLQWGCSLLKNKKYS